MINESTSTSTTTDPAATATVAQAAPEESKELDLAETLEAAGMGGQGQLVRAMVAQWTRFAEAATIDKIAAEIFVAHYVSVSPTLQADPQAVAKMAAQARRAATIFGERE